MYSNFIFSSPEQERLSDLSPEILGVGDRMALEPLNLNLNLKVFNSLILDNISIG